MAERAPNLSATRQLKALKRFEHAIREALHLERKAQRRSRGTCNTLALNESAVIAVALVTLNFATTYQVVTSLMQGTEHHHEAAGEVVVDFS
ncbi:hypothetical protein BBBOND_0303080 [Babesia bigemina]|uniref:Uncharacterized protein n=1 Tax=Babesia bigemina TaxID=5866 RepID=A0A061DBY5_BABBI|nr:hypothetical protein BBBOND_0303080 [Babesia bigemina]CDR96404.1 hypothetical protein BBBOND_0303080 [Babesia bigemina]|eukprot:XP_012768590.1 hypothetical protein BBBOND_0303080 [Babesia bigemina]